MASAEQPVDPPVGPVDSPPAPAHPLPGSVEALFPAGPEEQESRSWTRSLTVCRSVFAAGWRSTSRCCGGSSGCWFGRSPCTASLRRSHSTPLLVKLLSSTSLRPLFLLSVSLLGLMLLERWKHKLPLCNAQQTEAEPKQRGPADLEPRLLSVPELSLHLADSYLSCCWYLREMLAYKRHNHGKSQTEQRLNSCFTLLSSVRVVNELFKKTLLRAPTNHRPPLSHRQITDLVCHTGQSQTTCSQDSELASQARLLSDCDRQIGPRKRTDPLRQFAHAPE
ncbi:hypothetical protein WMY93_032829 [Mugilogobius chulae]|uniref:RETREG1-3/ARL6IP-like N-terminal reticulon-homology domain-containing protein n=1 Tax=Mugilogobius chulae TaxID=88201 RepID=A0AAW0MIK6_9GOBI